MLVVCHPLLQLREVCLPPLHQTCHTRQTERGVVVRIHLGVDYHPTRLAGRKERRRGWVWKGRNEEGEGGRRRKKKGGGGKRREEEEDEVEGRRGRRREEEGRGGRRKMKWNGRREEEEDEVEGRRGRRRREEVERRERKREWKGGRRRVKRMECEERKE